MEPKGGSSGQGRAGPSGGEGRACDAAALPPPPQKKTRPRPAANWLQSPKRAGALGAAQRGRALLYFAELANRRLPKNKRLATGAGMGLKGRP